MGKHVVAPLRELPPGSRMLVDVDGRAIVIFNIGGELFGLLNRCPHQGGNLSKGRLVGLVESNMPGEYRLSRPGEILRCPWHGWEFDVRTGQARCAPGQIRTKTYEVAAANGRDLMQQSYATQLAVNIEEDYVVIDV